MSALQSLTSWIGSIFVASQPQVYSAPTIDKSIFPESLQNATQPLASADYRTGSSLNSPFRGGQVTRKSGDWRPALSHGDNDLSRAWPLIHTRPRDAVINDPAASNVRRKFTNYVVGTGIVAFASAQVNGRLDYEYNDESDAWFERWAEDPSQCDWEGEHSWPEMQAAFFNEMQTVGNAYLIECLDDDKDRIVPLCYQLIEHEQLDVGKNRDSAPGVDKIVRGIQFDSRNRRVAYWFFGSHPYGGGDPIVTESQPIPADRVIHGYVAFRPSATQGVTWFNIMMTSSRDVETFLDSELVAAILGSYLTIVHETDSPSGTGIGFSVDGMPSNDENGNGLTRLGPGIIQRIKKGDKIEAVQSARPNPQIEPFAKMLNGRQAMGSGISPVRMTGDYSATTYSSSRAAHLDDQATFLPIQKFLGRKLVLPVRKRFNEFAVAQGLFTTVSAKQYLESRHRWSSFRIIGPGREQLDPEKETDASNALIDGLQSTLEEQCGLRGRNWRNVLRQRAEEERLIRLMFPEGRTLLRQTGGAPKESRQGGEKQNQSAEEGATEDVET